jgi:uncharacterized repeat protein (TIGR03803 family)
MSQAFNFRPHAILPFAAIIVFLVSVVVPKPSSGQTYTVVHVFNGSVDVPAFPVGMGVQGRDGKYYATSAGGNDGCTGSMYSATLTGTITTIDCLGSTTGDYPYGGVVLGSDGDIYTAVALGGADGDGAVFKVTTGGTETILHSFANNGDSGWANTPPVLATDGNYYGVAAANDEGNQFSSTFYKITPAGVFSTLHTFTSAEGNQCLFTIQGSDGNFYSACNYNGANNQGTLVKITKAGVVTVLHNFTSTDGGGNPAGGGPLVEANDGNYYGLTNNGGSDGYGVAYRITPTGTYTLLQNFNGANGSYPLFGMTLGPDGKMYGTTSRGGSDASCAGNCGTIFSLTTAGTLTTLYNFVAADSEAWYPQSNLMLDTSGVFYGTTNGSQQNGEVFYSFNMGFKPFASLVSTDGKESAQVGILGQKFSKSSVVAFGGTKATTVAVSGTTYLSATVPAGALTGPVTVTTGSSVLTTPQTFKVTPTMASFSPESGAVNTVVTITGTGLMQTTKVTFNAKAASFTVISDTEVTATVPTGATTGKIMVTTKGGTVTSTSSFTVN